MILVDLSPNDADLVQALGSFAVPAPIKEGDVNFHTYSGDSVCVERKHAGDLAQCILGGRYLSQAQAAHCAGFKVLVLIVENEIRPCPVTGLVQIPIYKSKMTAKSLRPRIAKVWVDLLPKIAYSRFDQYLTELDYLAGVLVKRSASVQETVAIIKALWLNFQTPPEDHQSLHQIYSAPNTSADLLNRPNLVRRVAKEVSGVGWVRSKAVAAKFPNVRAMVNAPVEQWLEIDGIGKKTSRQIVQELSGGDET
jgi:ERCC4-type nuclease